MADALRAANTDDEKALEATGGGNISCRQRVNNSSKCPPRVHSDADIPGYAGSAQTGEIEKYRAEVEKKISARESSGGDASADQELAEWKELVHAANLYVAMIGGRNGPGTASLAAQCAH